MRRAAWTVLGVLALLLTAALAWGAFTRFSHEPEPSAGHPAHVDYERDRYKEAQLSVVLGLGACFAFLAGAACLQRARRGRSSP